MYGLPSSTVGMIPTGDEGLACSTYGRLRNIDFQMSDTLCGPNPGPLWYIFDWDVLFRTRNYVEWVIESEATNLVHQMTE